MCSNYKFSSDQFIIQVCVGGATRTVITYYQVYNVESMWNPCHLPQVQWTWHGIHVDSMSIAPSIVVHGMESMWIPCHLPQVQWTWLGIHVDSMSFAHRQSSSHCLLHLTPSIFCHRYTRLTHNKTLQHFLTSVSVVYCIFHRLLIYHTLISFSCS